MKTYLECVEEAALLVGDKGETIYYVSFSLPQYVVEVLNKAADIYAEQSNSHKHGVVRGGANEAVIVHGDNTITEDKSQTTTLTTPTEPLPAEGSAKGVSVEMCSCGSIDVMTRYGIDQCADCGKPV